MHIHLVWISHSDRTDVSILIISADLGLSVITAGVNAAGKADFSGTTTNPHMLLFFFSIRDGLRVCHLTGTGSWVRS